MDWEKFFLVGGSVLKCILQDSFESTSSDIDFFFIGDDYCDYRSLIEDFRKDAIEYFDKDVYPEEKINSWKNKNTDIFDDYMYVRNLFLDFNGKKLKFQFIWYDCIETSSVMSPVKIFNIFDIDCCQVGFDGTDVRCSFPFIQSVNTGTFINYKFVNSKTNVKNFYPRTKKYMSRGFTLIHSKKFDRNLLESLNDDNEVWDEKKLDIRDKYAGFLINNDSMQVCNQFVKLFEEK